MLTRKEKQVLEKTVRRGSKLLDKELPGWRQQIRSKISRENPLRMASCRSCVIGKLMGNYDEVSRIIPEEELSGQSNPDSVVARYGYFLPDEMLDDDKHAEESWSYLENLWLKEIKEAK